MLRTKATVKMFFMAALILLGGLVVPVDALLADHDCSYCHDLHGAAGPQGLLDETTSEAVCLSCHSVSINDTSAVAVHNPNNRTSDQIDYITCRECHDPHDNYVNVIGNTNIKMVGIRFDPVTLQRFDAAKIRYENGSLGAYLDVTFDDRSDFIISGTGTGERGACEVCHAYPHRRDRGDCMSCHPHSAGFPKPMGGGGGGGGMGM